MFLFWVIICIEIDTVRERDRDRDGGRAEDCDANVNDDSDVDSLTELERQFRFQLWPTIRDTVKYSGYSGDNDNNNKNNNRSSVLLLLLWFCFFFYFFLLLLFLCSELYSQLRSRGVRFFAARRTNFDWSPNDSDGVTTTWGERDDDDDCACFQASFCFVSLLLLVSSSQCSLNSRSLAKSCLRHMFLLLLFLLFANFGFDYACSLGASLFDSCCCCCSFFLQTSVLASPALSSLHSALSVSHTHIMPWVSWQCSLLLGSLLIVLTLLLPRSIACYTWCCSLALITGSTISIKHTNTVSLSFFLSRPV